MRRGVLAVAVALAGAILPAVAVVASVPAADGATLRQLFEARGRYLGAAVDGMTMADRFVTGTVYGTLAGTEFGSLTPRHELAWDLTEPSRGSFDFSRSDPVVEFARRHGQRVRGEIVVPDGNLPPWVTAATSPDDLRAMLVGHVSGVVAHFRGRVAAWDVVRLPLGDDGTRRDTVFQRLLGDGYLAEALRAARAADPAAELYLGGAPTGGDPAGGDPAGRVVRGLVVPLLAQGVPLDGVGLRGGFALGRVPADLRADLQRYADLGLDVAFTRLEVRIRYPVDAAKLARQATDYAAVTRACLLVARCVGMTVDGVYDTESGAGFEFPGYGRPLLFDDSFARKPAYRGVATAVRRVCGTCAR